MEGKVMHKECKECGIWKGKKNYGREGGDMKREKINMAGMGDMEGEKRNMAGKGGGGVGKGKGGGEYRREMNTERWQGKERMEEEKRGGRQERNVRCGRKRGDKWKGND
jgi:hypothetical protein